MYEGTSRTLFAKYAVPLVEILIAVSMAVALGAGIMISGQLARNEKERALQVFHTALLCAGMISIFIAVFGNLFIHPLTELLGSTPQIHGEATEYVRYIVSFSPFLIFSILILLPHFLFKKGNQTAGGEYALAN